MDPRNRSARPLVRSIAEVEAALFDRMIDDSGLHFRAHRSVFGAARRAVADALRNLAGAIAP